MQFIRLIIQEPCHAYFNMALDEAISDAVRKKISPPTLRLYGWDRPSLSIGYFQKISDVDLKYCEARDYPVVRRLTGGRAILHDSELTYSFTCSNVSPIFNGSLSEDYTVISNALLHALKTAGAEAKASFIKKRRNDYRNPACFKTVSFGEITVNGKKVIGSAQKRYRDGFLQHGSIVFDFDAKELCAVLKGNSIEDFRGMGALRNSLPSLTINKLSLNVKEAFEYTLRMKLISDKPSAHELKLAEELQSNKYSSNEWNSKR
jgi:lipoate-protein ligase A